MDTKSTLSSQELLRYSRHLNLPDFGIAEQQKLNSAKVLVVGTGGLGSPVLQYLTAVGIGTIGLIDFDVVDLSNLQRQVLFTTDDVGKSKVFVAEKRLKAINPHIHFTTYNEALNNGNAIEIIKDFDIIVDGTDNFPTRYLINDACVLLNKVNVHASVFRYEGQVSVFNFQNNDGSRGPNYRDLFPKPPAPEFVSSCAEGGILGVLPGILGSIQALEVIKIIINNGETLSGRLFIFDAKSLNTRILKFNKNPENPISGDNPSITSLIDYKDFCGHNNSQTENLLSVNVETLKEWQQNDPYGYQLIDVREAHEYTLGNISGDLLPLSDLENLIDKISQEKKVVVHCKSGARSRKAITLLTKKYKLKKLYNLEGGIVAWKNKYDPDLSV